MPTITIDLTWFTQALNAAMQMSPLTLAWTVFKYGGFLPIVIVAWNVFKEHWLESRQHKYAKTLTFTLLNINTPRLNEQTPKAVEQIFAHLSGTHSTPNFKEKWWLGKFSPPISFELASINGYTQFIVRTPTVFRDLIEASVFSQYPDAEITEIADYTHAVPDHYPDPEWDCWGTEFGLAKDSAYPIRVWKEFEHEASGEFKDPLGTLLESMSRIKKDEQLWIQILLWTTDQSWAKEGMGVVKKMLGKEVKHKAGVAEQVGHHISDIALGVVREMTTLSSSAEAPKKEEKKDKVELSPGERKTVEAIENKITKLGYKAKLRMVYVGKRSAFRKGAIISMIRGALGLFGSLDGNSFKAYGPAAPKTDYFWQAWSADKKKTSVMHAYKGREEGDGPSGILNTEELATIWHFPQTLGVKAPLIKKVDSKKVEPPFQLPAV